MNFSSIIVCLFACLVLFASVSYTDGLRMQERREAVLDKIKAAVNAQKSKVVRENHGTFSGRNIINQMKQRRNIK